MVEDDPDVFVMFAKFRYEKKIALKVFKISAKASRLAIDIDARVATHHGSMPCLLEAYVLSGGDSVSAC